MPHLGRKSGNWGCLGRKCPIWGENPEIGVFRSKMPFGLNFVLRHSQSISTQKNYSDQNFWLSHFFAILAILAEKRQSPSKNILHGKNFRFRDFRFKIRFETFWIDSDQKKFSTKIFWLCLFFTILAMLAEKRQSPGKEILHRKKFSISRFLV